MAGAEGGARLDAQVDGAGRGAAAVVHAVDEEAPGPHRRQARQRHGQPVGVGQGLDGDAQLGMAGQGAFSPSTSSSEVGKASMRQTLRSSSSSRIE
jgi:hypothetical protein